MMHFYGFSFADPRLGLGVGGLVGILFWALLIFLFIVVLASIFSGGGGSEKESSEERGNRALDILKERYAKGEIDKEEFDKMKKDLS